MTDKLYSVHQAVLGAMDQTGPLPFEGIAAALAGAIGAPEYATLNPMLDRLNSAEPGDPLATLWNHYLTRWDFDEHATWSAFPARTDERRADAYAKLGLPEGIRTVLNDQCAIFKAAGPVVISKDAAFEPWYMLDGSPSRPPFYWKAYENLLRDKGWSPDAIASLDQAARSIVERLADPTREDPYGARGLVVGYVQSGKTANFTGVIAKAIDAGYRLVIVLGGTLNLLRGQTQRRLDMELIGQENILRGADPNDPDALVGIDYQDDPDWPEKFVSHGGRPSMRNAFDIERLTTRDDDYRQLFSGIKALEIGKHDPKKPLYSPENLHRASARVMVVKKNKSVLTNLVQDLKKIGPLLGEIPALIIDDESDQASVNTIDPKKWESGTVQRTAINQLITQLLKTLPRAQYVGYTATPFANVFVDPSDEEDIFPRDFLLSLPRPTEYMGVQEFHDFDSAVPEEERTVANSKEKAHVRGITENTGDRLQEAMDAFVLTGALKLYRVSKGIHQGPFRHHTMLVHESVRTSEHNALAERLITMWHNSEYTGPNGHARLAKLFENDFSLVSAAQAEGLPTPSSYEELRPFVSTARQMITQGGTPVIVVNGDTDRYFAELDLDFDRTDHVWKILVGGTKLSRGFTVEGLTVTYYRRTTQQADTLMQMGRWFGFRPNYRDLVRLYIGREETVGKKTVDLYEAFEAICLDEEHFRAELARYSTLVDGKPQLTPAQIPPLVAQHLPGVRPSARNKMFNAELVEIRSPGRPIEPAAFPYDKAMTARNTERWEPVLKTLSGTEVCQLLPDSTTPLARTFQAASTVVDHAQLLSILSSLEWEHGNVLAPHLTYLAQLDGRLAKVDDWLVLAPHRTARKRIEATILGHGPFSLSRRSRQDGKASFGRISGMEHRAYAQWLIDQAEAGEAVTGGLGQHRGVVLLYPVVEASSDAEVNAAAADGTVDPSKVITAFTVIPPRAAIDSKRQLVRFQAKDSSQPDAVIIDAPGS
ncbi:Z1 domain-containing protein [Streptomyces sp. NPDC005012]|uniref:Z1 domain-containing protein n=1 Tax=Streptomyces sp. NPDC005012 TaxID=3154558 RepID=UPI0033A871E3